MQVRARLKAAIERGMLQGGVASIARRRVRHDTLVLAYHNIVPHGATTDGDRSLHLAQRAFVEQLDLLCGSCDIVPLAAALAGPSTSGRPRVVITFDDAYAGAVVAGVEELTRRSLPATIFVAPAFVGGGTFWWDAFADRGAGAPDPVFRAHALAELRGRDEDIRRWAASAGNQARVVPEHARCASEPDIAAAAHTPGITLGSHSWSHPNLARSTDAELELELRESLAWLRARFDDAQPCISYPYGAWSPTVERAAADAGYRAGFRIEGGWMRREAGNPFALPRMDVPSGISIDGFALRIAGLFAA